MQGGQGTLALRILAQLPPWSSSAASIWQLLSQGGQGTLALRPGLPLLPFRGSVGRGTWETSGSMGEC